MRFFHYTLRTSDVAAARAFYAAVLGRDDAEIFQLHEAAVARGARPHWLGCVEVAELAAAVAAFGARGAASLGPRWVNPQGLEAQVMRDPGGAILALAKRTAGGAVAAGPEVVWHLLNTADVERAKASYRELFGWEPQASVDVGSHGVLHPFAWQPGGVAVGSMSDIAQRPGVHPHWLFHFGVPALEPALAAVHAAGGTSLGPFVLPSGDRIAVVDDPQGAAFGLFEARSPR